MYQSTKTYEPGFSCAFRQWRADSHCKLLHGYALSFKFVFEAETLNANNWVVDFGGLDVLKQRLADMFDHTTVIATDDPQRPMFREFHDRNVINIRYMSNVGCEAFAKLAYAIAQEVTQTLWPRVSVVSAECREHGANSAIYMRPANEVQR